MISPRHDASSLWRLPSRDSDNAIINEAMWSIQWRAFLSVAVDFRVCTNYKLATSEISLSQATITLSFLSSFFALVHYSLLLSLCSLVSQLDSFLFFCFSQIACSHGFLSMNISTCKLKEKTNLTHR